MELQPILLIISVNQYIEDRKKKRLLDTFHLEVGTNFSSGLLHLHEVS